MKKRYLVVLALIIVGGSLVTYSITSSPTLKKQFDKIAMFIDQHDDFFLMYQNLANPYIRYVRIPAGLRKEEIAMIYTKNLSWDADDINNFLNAGAPNQVNLEGHYFPSTYILSADADGTSVKNEMLNKFDDSIFTALEKNKLSINKNVLNIDTAVKIASLIQREAAGKQDMNIISGIIWNRIWNGMSLDIDATLQYAKGNDEKGWWPQVHSEDKKINSPYNTYKNKGLPPSPIANPSADAIEAAYNPTKTNCIFYLHDNNRQIHCSKTYAEHQALVEQYLR